MTHRKGNGRSLKRLARFFLISIVLALLLSACEAINLEIPWLSQDAPTATVAPGEEQDETPAPEPTSTLEPTPEEVTSLTLWVPPSMDPALETDASQLLMNQLDLFSDLHDGIEVNVRVKAASGAGGLLDSLTATSAAAPDALPDLIALTRPDLETAALKGLIYPMDGLTEIPDDSDWFEFTRDMALLQGSTFGLPFASDALGLVYRTELIPELPNSWSSLMGAEIPLAFPGESDQSLFPLALYLSAGGSIQDNQRRPILEVAPLSDVFYVIQEGVTAGTLVEASTQFQTMGQAWTAFNDGQADLVATWISNYLTEGTTDMTLTPLLPISDGVVSLGTGTCWALATSKTYRHPMAVELAEFLVQPEFISDWSAAAGVLPTRPSALDKWQGQSLVTKLNQIANITQLIPSNDLIASLGPVLRDGSRQVLQGLVDPAQAAQVSVESLEEQ